MLSQNLARLMDFINQEHLIYYLKKIGFFNPLFGKANNLTQDLDQVVQRRNAETIEDTNL